MSREVAVVNVELRWEKGLDRAEKRGRWKARRLDERNREGALGIE